jgi:TonB-dependent receptor
VSHPFWLPNVNLRFRPFTWFDVRLSYSHTISYPDFYTIIPRIDAPSNPDPSNPILWNNYLLKPSRSRNYDVNFSFYENTVGLFTVGAFLKRIEDLIYPWQFSKVGAEAKPYYLTNKQPNTNTAYYFSSYRNNPYVVESWGLEFDWQTHFWYLPNPFKGLVLNVNYTHVYSKAEYPYHMRIQNGRVFREVDTSFTDRLISQPNHILNLSVGYDYADFSVRVSMLYQADIFSIPSQWSQMRASTAAYKRWDVSIKQRLPWYGLQVYGSLNNINGARDQAVLQMYSTIPTTEEMYGLTAELGLRIQL